MPLKAVIFTTGEAVMSSYHTLLKEAYAGLRSQRYIALPNNPYVSVKDLFLYLLDKEGVESLPLYLNVHFVRLKKGSTCQYLCDESLKWNNLILEKLTSG